MKKLTDDELIAELKGRFEFNRKALKSLQAMTRKLEVMNQKLQESEALKSHFLSNIRNEINNPLAAIMGISSQLAAPESDPARIAAMARMIYTEAFNLDFQLQNIFTAAELEAGEAVPFPARVDVCALAAHVSGQLEHLSAPKGVAVENQLAADLHFITDARKLHVMLINLLATAVEFSPEKGVVTRRGGNAGGRRPGTLDQGFRPGDRPGGPGDDLRPLQADGVRPHQVSPGAWAWPERHPGPGRAVEWQHHPDQRPRPGVRIHHRPSQAGGLRRCAGPGRKSLPLRAERNLLKAPVPNAADKPQHFLYPGALFAHQQPHLVTTVLGSCVSVCLWDPVLRAGGINHYLLPLWNGEGLPTPRYGNIAIVRLIEKMLALGCARERLQAKVFGGAAMWRQSQGLLAVGERNRALATDLLAENHIPIVSADTGGEAGRKIIFDTETGSVLLRRNRGNLDLDEHRPPET